MSAIRRGMTLEEIAGVVCEALTTEGVAVVLSGGAVVSIYTENEYASFDLDFIPEGLATKVGTAMTRLGFSKGRERYWQHPETELGVEFPPGPPAIGDTRVEEIAERDTGVGILRLLPPTECVMDRLASFYHWTDRQALDQAVAVTRAQPVDLERVKAWSEREGPRGREGFAEFCAQLEAG